MLGFIQVPLLQKVRMLRLLGCSVVLVVVATAALCSSALSATIGSPVVVGQIPLVEASGLASSRVHPGIHYTHNDSGSGPVVSAITTAGVVKATMTLTSANDWEDIAVGPGAGGLSSIYVGDIGDNALNRDRIRVMRIAEPNPLTSAVYTTQNMQVLDLAYPDGPHNAESLIVDPRTSDLFVVTRSDGPSGTGVGVYRATQSFFNQANTGIKQTMSYVTDLPGLTDLRAGDISPDGRWIVLRNKTDGWLYERGENQTIGQAFAGTPVKFQMISEVQGEAIGWAADGSGFYTTSEGRNQPIYFYPFAVPEPSSALLLGLGLLALGGWRVQGSRRFGVR